MKKKILITFIVIIVSLAYGVYWAFFDMNRLPKGELISEVQSPNGVYTIKAYLTNGGATTSYAIRGELNYNNSRRKPKNIYWNYREEEASIELNVPNEKFDFRRNR